MQPQSQGPDLQGTAAVEATDIVARAQATAMVLQANAQAQEILRLQPVEATPGIMADRDVESGAGTVLQTAQVTLAPSPTGDPSEDVQVVAVTFAADGALIMVEYLAPPALARGWSQGSVFVQEETSGQIYDHIPVAGPIGPLFAHPAHLGQKAYVMFVNADPPLVRGATVTVVLGAFKKEHVLVQ